MESSAVLFVWFVFSNEWKQGFEGGVSVWTRTRLYSKWNFFNNLSIVEVDDYEEIVSIKLTARIYFIPAQ